MALNLNLWILNLMYNFFVEFNFVIESQIYFYTINYSTFLIQFKIIFKYNALLNLIHNQTLECIHDVKFGLFLSKSIKKPSSLIIF